jgi:signal transduction histidine kinase/ActR/RegA family two-component response regulator
VVSLCILGLLNGLLALGSHLLAIRIAEVPLGAIPLASAIIGLLTLPRSYAFASLLTCWAPWILLSGRNNFGGDLAFPIAGIGLSLLTAAVLKLFDVSSVELLRFRDVIIFALILLAVGASLSPLAGVGFSVTMSALSACWLLVLVAIGLACWHPSQSVWRPRRLRLAVPLVCLLSLAIGLHEFGKRAENNQAESELKTNSELLARLVSREGEFLWNSMENQRVAVSPKQWTMASIGSETRTLAVKLRAEVPAVRDTVIFSANDIPAEFASLVNSHLKSRGQSPLGIWRKSERELIALTATTFADGQRGYLACYLDWDIISGSMKSETLGLRATLLDPQADLNSSTTSVLTPILFAKNEFLLSTEQVATGAGPTSWLRPSLAILSLITLCGGFCLLLALGNQPRLLEACVVAETRKLRREFEAHQAEFRVQLTSSVQANQRTLELVSGGVSHEFNTLLTHLQSEAEAAQQLLPTYAPSQKHLGRINRLIGKSAEICEQLAATTGNGTLIEQSCNLAEIVRSTCDEVRSQLPQAPVLSVTCVEADFWMRADRSRIERLLRNLLWNAAEAYDGVGGEIHVQLSEESECGRLRLVVQDFGCGIPEAILDRVVEPFFSTKKYGRGLGLTAVLGIAKQHHGEVVVQGRPQAGTTVEVLFGCRITLSEITTPSRSTSRTEVLDIPTNRQVVNSAVRTAIVADDDPTIRTYVSGILEREGWTVLLAENGHQALTWYRQHPEAVSLVVLDLLMPEMDGRDTIQLLSAAGYESRVIVMSAYSDFDLTREFESNANLQLLRKPFRSHELIECLAAELVLGPVETAAV